MAEIGTVAAAAQLAGYGAKVVILSAKLYQQLRDAPKKVQSKISTIHHAEVLVKSIGTELEAAGPGHLPSIISLEAVEEVSDLVQAWLIRAEYLSALLDNLVSRLGDSRLRKGVKRARALQLEKEIDGQLEELDKLVRTLNLWYSHQNLCIWQQHLVSSSLTQAGLRTLQQQVEECNASIQNMIQSLPQIKPCISQRKQRRSSSSSTANGLRSPAQQQRHDEAYVDHYPIADADPLGMCNCCTRISGSGVNKSYIIGPLKFFYQTDAHCDGCPLKKFSVTRRYGVTAKLRLSTGFNITMLFQSVSGGPVLQLSPQIVATRIVDRDGSPAFSVLMQMGEELCRATGKTSAGESWWLSTYSCEPSGARSYGCVDNVRTALQDVIEKLEFNFRMGLASARDEDQNGSTLLHEFVRFISPAWHLQDEIYDTLADVVALLVRYGVEINARTLHKSMKMCTALDVCFLDVTGFESFKSCHTLRFSRVDRLISNHGGETTRWKVGPGFPCEVRVILNNPDLAIDYGCSALSLAVIHRDLSAVKQAASMYSNIDGSSGDPHSPLSFSLGWPKGMRYLLEAGADPSTAIHPAVFFGDEQAVTMLLEYDCRIFRDYSVQYPMQSSWNCPFEGDSRKAPMDSVLEYSLWSYLYSNGWDRCPKIGNMPSIRKRIADYIAASRKGLMKLARSKISQSELIELGCDKGETVIDKAAIPVIKRLEQLGVQVPRSMQPGKHRTVYHMRYLDSATAECLYKAGFYDIDVEDDIGWTPLLLACSGMVHKESLDSSDPLPSWYLSHGVFPWTTDASKGTTHLHILARRFRYYLRCYEPFDEKISRMADTFSHLASFISLTSSDDCECPCSNTGCLPSTIFLKAQSSRRSRSRPLNWELKYLYLQRAFLEKDVLGKSREIHTAAARLEMFERLEITHTCCFGIGPRRRFSNSEDSQNIHEEERLLIRYLEDWMGIYHDLEEEFAEDFFLFWEAWWEAISRFMPERPWDQVTMEDGKPAWVQDQDYDYPGITEYGPNNLMVRIEVGFWLEYFRERQGEWAEFVNLDCDLFDPSASDRKDSMFSC